MVTVNEILIKFRAIIIDSEFYIKKSIFFLEKIPFVIYVIKFS